MARNSDQLARLNRRMKVIPLAARQAVQPALDKSADELVAQIERLAPVDEGDLRDSAEARPGEHELQRVVTVGDDVAFYARWVEFGTVENAPQPYFFPAYRLLKKRLSNRIKRAIGKAVREAAS